VVGHWITREAFFENYPTQAFGFLPRKPDWPIDPALCDAWQPMAALRSRLVEILDSNQSPMIWIRDEKGDFKRLFVTFWT